MNFLKLLFVSILSVAPCGTVALAAEPLVPERLPAGQAMYVIEREIPGAGKMTAADLKSASQQSCAVLRKLGPRITWVQSYVTNDRLYCVYVAQDEELIRLHAKDSGFPASAVSQVMTIIGPKTAD